MNRAAFLLPLMAACSGSKGASSREPAPLSASARVEGRQVIVTAQCPAYWKIEIAGQTEYCTGEGARVELPAAKLGAGHHEVAMKATSSDTPTVLSGQFAVDVPAAVVAPFFEITGCESDYSPESVQLFVKGGGATQQMCSSFHGARVKLEVKASPGAKLTFGTQTITMPDTGESEPIVDLTDVLLGMTIDQLATDGMGASPTLSLPWKLDVGASHLSGTLEVTEEVGEGGKLARQMLKDIAAGKVDRPPFAAPKPGERRTIAFLDLGGTAVPTDRRGTVRDLDLVAVETEAARTETGVCDFDSSGKIVQARRFSVDVVVTVTDLATGGVVATKKFSPPPDSCPMFEMMDPRDPQTSVRPNNDTIMAWLETLTRAAS